MGILFSRPSLDANVLSLGLYPAGNVSSVDSPTIGPYLGINSGLYDGIPADHWPAIPYEWIVSPTPGQISDASCPNGANILTWFGVTEAIITVLTPLVAYRPFIHYISRGYLGRRIKSSVSVTWTIPLALQLLANAIIAAMVGHTAGYGKLNMLRIFTVYIARPRFYPIVVGLLRCLVPVKRPREWAKTTIVQHKVDDRVEFPYTDAWIATSISETVLLVITAIFTGVTWHRMPSESKPRDYISDHVNFVASAPALMFLAMIALVPVYKRYGEAFPIEGRRYETGRQWGATVSRDGRARVRVKKSRQQAVLKRVASAAAGAVLLGYVTLVQWAYWTRFLSMTGLL